MIRTVPHVPVAFAALLLWFPLPGGGTAAAEPEGEQPLYSSGVIGAGAVVDIDVAIGSARQLWLVVTDGGDGFGCDWADWVEPRLVSTGGEVRKLTSVKWKSARAGWGRVRIDRNAGGGPLRVGAEAIPYGIGTHAPSVIHFELPGGFQRFRARAGLDAGGTDQGCGSTVEFVVFTRAPRGLLAAAPRERSGPLEPEEALATLDVVDGCEATLFAHEPMVVNPTNLDIDARGRVWVTEGVNYRRWKDLRPQGDRIVILEDTDGDGKADHSKVYYQDRSIDSALGICVLGTRVIVSCAPNVFIFTDEDGDDVPERKELLFQGIGGLQHDHGVHAFVFGPDGKLYFNFGNSGNQILDAAGKPVVDTAGNRVRGDGRPYRQGMVFRCNPDGSEFETLGHNFRNNYEVAVDSFGTLWQSDNDDDGNFGVRINYVMEFGNFGYQDEITGAGWGRPRTNMHPEKPLRHWHQNDPGVVPNLLGTGAGSPTGLVIYEADLLPAEFRNQMLHCEPGHNVVRAYPVENAGAGYEAGVVNLVKSEDRWFRPSDVCIAADGSVFIADWYDAGVGGHAMADNDPQKVRGRIYRVAPAGHNRVVPPLNLGSAADAVAGLRSPNHARRHLAWKAVHALGKAAEQPLLDLWRGSDQRLRARAFHLLARIDGEGARHVSAALADPNPDIRITGLRTARMLKLDVIAAVRKLVDDPSPQVRRECAIALRHNPSPAAPELWARLALQHDGRDRWYLEALGIGADRQEDAFFAAWLERAGDRWRSTAGRDIIWRSRATAAARWLVKLTTAEDTPPPERPRYLRAFDFLRGPEKQAALVDLLASPDPDVAKEALARLEGFDPAGKPEHRALLDRLVADSRGTPRLVDLVRRFEIRGEDDNVLRVALDHAADSAGANAARWLLESGARRLLESALQKDVPTAVKIARALGNAADRRAVPLLVAVAVDHDRPPVVSGQAIRSLARTKEGAGELLKLARDGKLPEDGKAVAGASLYNVPWRDIQSEAARVLPLLQGKERKPLPPVSELVKRRGDASRGARVYDAQCKTCHQVDGRGADYGPDLSAIGDKLGRDALYLSILDPNAGVSFDYEGTVLVVKPGNQVVGIVTSETDDELTLKMADAIVATYKKGDVLRRAPLNTSIMPANLQANMTTAELVDLVEYLTTLKKEEQR